MVQVRYIRSPDGTQIAFATSGQGRPLVYMPPLPFRHVELEWDSPGDRRTMDWLSARHTLVQYDPRGFGLSDRAPASHSLESHIADLHAVIAETAPDGAVLFGSVNMGVIALAYALAHPDRVTAMILWCASPRASDGMGPHTDAILDLVDRDWELATQTMGHALRGWSSSGPAAKMAELLRACATPESIRAVRDSLLALDLGPRLSEVRVPTLVLHRRGVEWVSVEVATALARGIPGARLNLLEGDSMAPWAGNFDEAMESIQAFLGGTPPRERAPNENCFRREGEYWTLAFEGEVARVRHAKGLHHIHYLLMRPGTAVAAAELMLDLEPPPDTAPDPRSLGDAGPLLDPQARRAYANRLDDLQDEVAEAERNNDGTRAARAREEIEAIEDQLTQALGLGGRDRTAASAPERMRLTVTKRIRDALARVRKVHPALGEHLETSLRTGGLCAYRPVQTTDWVL